MKRITFTSTEDQAKFLSLYQKVQEVPNPQDIISLALDKLEREEKSSLYDKLEELVSSGGVAKHAAATMTPSVGSSRTSGTDSSDDGNNQE